MTFQKPDKDKKPFECPHCGGMNCTQYNDYDTNVMGCADCDSTWTEYEDEWVSVFQKGRIIRENEN